MATPTQPLRRLFLYAADAVYGSLGMVLKDDLVFIISKSGESPEIKALVPLVRIWQPGGGDGKQILFLYGTKIPFLLNAR
ncbi:MAG: hypothetical protein R2796_12165 [Chitinophagaceae bacterium]